MNAWLVIGIILLIVGVVLFFVRRHQQSRAFSIKSARRVNVAELEKMAQRSRLKLGEATGETTLSSGGKLTRHSP
ncbi:MAG: hypothetical protein HC886_11695 [Leptolyngbyaceae cyanobacterium SM1_1_3]|nr:hypothetical protein [Leptolyngbyaceae cyanobacterium SM1_1_3]